jgi:hypothetical protein
MMTLVSPGVLQACPIRPPACTKLFNTRLRANGKHFHEVSDQAPHLQNPTPDEVYEWLVLLYNSHGLHRHDSPEFAQVYSISQPLLGGGITRPRPDLYEIYVDSLHIRISKVFA